MPVFNLNKYKGGFHEQTYNQRKKPFGSLAARTLGDMYADTAQGAKNGIELAFDTLLKGRDGITHRQKVRNKYLNITDIAPVDGCDIISTLDVGMQDICEKALVDKLKEINANVGVAVLMEVETGEVKAIVNMTKAGDGRYYEMRNNAISDMMEPGSTFKTASIMVALEDGKITPETEVDTGNGIMNMHGSQMRDHNWHRGGYGKIDVTRILEVSSNIGVSYLIDKYYKDNPQKYVDGLKRMGIDQALQLQISGEGKPNIKGPKERYFAKTTLPWMSIGYETQIPPLNILTFYNAIANNGGKVRAHFMAISSSGKRLNLTSDQFSINRSADQVKHVEDGVKMSLGGGENTDYAFARVGQSGGLKSDKSASTSLDRGTKLTILGFPLGLGANSPTSIKPVSSTATVGIDGLDRGVILTSETNFEHGCSGGPALITDGDGNYTVIGIVSAIAGRNTGFIVPISNVN